MVALAQSAEHRIVAPKVTGSSPVGHPTFTHERQRVAAAAPQLHLTISLTASALLGSVVDVTVTSRFTDEPTVAPDKTVTLALMACSGPSDPHGPLATPRALAG
jgi:hypothetical protein